jgi:NAD(P)-dependent dehydrogenase (short-subunit alcohol dehydrogenase family)
LEDTWIIRIGTLLAAGAVCHVPYRSEEEAKRFAHRDHKQVSLVPLADLADEPAVTAFYGGLTTLWASIHIAGGFAFAPIAQSDKTLLSAQLDSNLIRPVAHGYARQPQVDAESRLRCLVTRGAVVPAYGKV